MYATNHETLSQLVVSAPPHVRTADSVARIMYSVVLALLPALAGAVYFFGWPALKLTALAVATAVATEAAIQKFRGVEITALDGSAIVTGMLLAFNLPPGVPWWIPVAGTAFAIALGKQAFGGLGLNPMNPALLGRAFLMASWPVHMTTDWITAPVQAASGVAAVTGATPLAAVKEAMKNLSAGVDVGHSQAVVEAAGTAASHLSLFLGSASGAIGESSAVLLLLGAAFLFARRSINYRIPVAFIGTVALLAWIFGGTGYFTGDWVFHVLAGGLILGAFFMATDMATSPSTALGQWIFGCGCGLLTAVIRLVGGYPEGVSYAILLMNILTPLLDRYTRPKPFGA